MNSTRDSNEIAMTAPVIQPTERRVLANGLSHHVLEWGTSNPGTPIVLAHGFMDHAWSYHWLAQRLAQTRRVFAFSWRGHGETDWVGQGGYYHFPDYVLDQHELLPQLTSSYHLFGHSMGGTATALFASTRPPALRSLTLAEGLGPPSGTLENNANRLNDFLRSVSKVRTAAPGTLASIEEAARRLGTRHGELGRDELRFLAEKGTRQTPSGLQWCFDPLHRTSAPTAFAVEIFKKLLTRIDVPVLVLTGDRGFRTSDHAERVSSLRDVHETILADTSHMVHWVAVDSVARALLSHVERVESTANADESDS